MTDPTATAAGSDTSHPILCRCRQCLAEDYGYEPPIDPDPALIDDGAA